MHISKLLRPNPAPYSARLIALGILLFGMNPIASADNPMHWLERMQKAVHMLDYEGRFVYQTGSHIESMYVVHRVHGEQELERLVALDGEPREIIRGKDAIAFIKPGHHPVSVEQTPNQYALSLQHKLDYQHLAAYYQIKLSGENRVAGRITQVIEITPRDDLRYGHRLYLDQATALPLRSVLLDTHAQPVCQNLFVDIKIGENITPIEHDMSALAHIHPKQTKAKPTAQQIEWSFVNVPRGYVQKSYRYQPERQREHFIFSDGLSSVSLYIEQPGGEKIAGHSSIGVTHTLALEKYARQITLIGEAPIQALQQLAEALQPND